jgi:hypothetical protein
MAMVGGALTVVVSKSMPVRLAVVTVAACGSRGAKV